MARLLTLLVLVGSVAGCSGPQVAPPGCDALVLDLDRGTLNGLAPTATMDEVKEQFPCSTGESEEGAIYNFGGGVFFLNHDMYAYTHRDFFEVRDEFAGVTSPASIGEPLASFGEPDRVAAGASLFERRYGCLRLEADDEGTIAEVGVHAEACETLEVPR